MSAVVFALGAAWIAVVALLVLVLFIQVLAGHRAPPQARAANLRVPRYRVLMPAHDEAGTIQETIGAVLQQLSPAGSLLVVADNCSDTTAAEARAAGAEVVERTDALLRGKGHALAFGLDQLRGAPPEVVIILDADCLPAPGALDLLASRAAALEAPVQSLYLMLAPPGSSLRVRMAAFAWALRNQVRPLGMHRLGLPCQLMGSGMAFPWPCIAGVEMGSSHLTEDLQLGVKLAQAGHAPRFCPEARVHSSFPREGSALDSQRKRWEHGHLSMILTGMPALLLRRWGAGSAAAAALALDLCVPPLALLALMVLAACAVGGWMLATDGTGWASVAAVSAVAFAAALLLAWWRVGRQWVRLRELLFAPVYIVRKLPVYASFVFRRQKEWVRTARHR